MSPILDKQTMQTTRRVFSIRSLQALGALTAAQCGQLAWAQTPSNLVSESDAQAMALGYRSDASKVDAAKHPNRQPTQMCGGCVLFSGKAEDKTGPCAAFAGKHVASKGWCSAWSKRA